MCPCSKGSQQHPGHALGRVFPAGQGWWSFPSAQPLKDTFGALGPVWALQTKKGMELLK